MEETLDHKHKSIVTTSGCKKQGCLRLWPTLFWISLILNFIILSLDHIHKHITNTKAQVISEVDTLVKLIGTGKNLSLSLATLVWPDLDRPILNSSFRGD